MQGPPMQRKSAQLAAVVAALLLSVSIVQIHALRSSANEASRPAFTSADASFPDAGTGFEPTGAATGQHHALRDSGTSPFPATQQHLVPQLKTIFGPDDRVQLSPAFTPVAWLILWDAT